jgi:hypothetical protein
MSHDSKALHAYKTFVYNTLGELINDFKSKIDSLPVDKKNIIYISEKVKDFLASPQVSEFLNDSKWMVEPLEPDDKLIAAKVTEILLKDLSKHVTNMLSIDDEWTFDRRLEEIKQNPPKPSSKSRSYDQVVKGDVKISKVKNNSEYSHKIKFNKIGKFLQYQVWDPTGIVQTTYLPRYPSNDTHPREFNEAKKYVKANPYKVVTVDYPINDDRDVKLKTGKEWVLFFNSIRNFSPTTVMQIGYKKHVFVIKKAKINKNDKVVFYISTKEIQVNNNNNNNNSEQMKNLKKIPLGKHKNVRFDIDYGNSIQSAGCSWNSLGDGTQGTTTCYCPAGTYISAVGVLGPSTCITDCDAGESVYVGVCYDDCDSGYYTDGVSCSQECTGDTWSSGIFCDHETWIGAWPDYTKHIYTRGGAYIPESFEWGTSDGYICDSVMYGNDYCVSGQGVCYNINTEDGSDTQQCCIPEGDSMCCPPGSSC